MRTSNILFLIFLFYSIQAKVQDSALVFDCNCSTLSVKNGFTYCDTSMAKKANGLFQCEQISKEGTCWTEYNYVNGVRTGEYKHTQQQNVWSKKASGEFLREEKFNELVQSKCKAILVELNFQYFYKTIEVVAYNPEIEINKEIIDFLVQNVFQPLKKKYKCDQIVFALNINGFYDQQLNYDEFYRK